MKTERIVILLGGILIWGLLTSCQEKEPIIEVIDDPGKEVFGSEIILTVEYFHRIYLEKGIDELNIRQENPGVIKKDDIFQAVATYVDDFHWNIEHIEKNAMSIISMTIDEFDAIFDIFATNDKNWAASVFDSWLSGKSDESSELSFSSIAPYAAEMAEILSGGSDYSNPEEHFSYIKDQLLRVRSLAGKELNELELFVIDNTMEIGLSSMQSWASEVYTEEKSFAKDDDDDDDEGIDWEYIGKLAKADAIGGAANCGINVDKIVAAFLLGPKGGATVAGILFGKGALVGSLSYGALEVTGVN